MDIFNGRLKGLDLFSGIGGNTLGLRDYIKTIAYCEADKHAQSVLLSRMGDGSIELAPIWDDITTLTGKHFDVPIDIIVGGFPCQDISVAGKGEGIVEGNRSGLFYQVLRLAKEIKPTFLFLENVPAIRTRGLDAVVQELTEIGYDLRWTMLSAADVGAPHKRERWFLLGYSKYDGRTSAEIPRSNAEADSEKQTRATISTESQGASEYRNVSNDFSDVADPRRKRFETRKDRDMGSPSSEEKGEWHKFTPSIECSDSAVADVTTIEGVAQSNLGGMVDGISDELDFCESNYLDSTYWEKEPKDVPRVTEEKEQRIERIKRLGNAVVPLQAKTAFEILLGIKKT